MEQNVICGNNIELLKSYPDNHFDAIVTDPPYGLGKEPNAEDMLREWLKSGYMEVKGGGFMGKEWDAFVPQPIFWKEVFRVLKPGGYVLAFYGTRTYDWGVMAMRLAGFEVRDCVQWIYGSGFPKSHNISKAIDKMSKANNRLLEFAELLKLKRLEKGLSLSEADGLITGGSTMYSFLEGRNVEGCLKVYAPNKSHYEKIVEVFGLKGWDDIIENNLEVIGDKDGSFGYQKNSERWNENTKITAATTPQAKQWEGWGSALKPAVEPIVVCRKPLEKGLSIAENVLKWGVGGINIDGCRVGEEIIKGQKAGQGFNNVKGFSVNTKLGEEAAKEYKSQDTQGRFPANIILECICDGDTHTNPDCPCYIMDRQSGGNASRFFYQAKASKSERNRGLEGFEERNSQHDFGTKLGVKRSERVHTPKQNFHPTVKPVKLMQYLVRLVTPPNGLVLDPFCGSGTTGIACRLEGFNFVGMEREEDYAKIAQARIDNWFGASAKDSVSESSSLVESASAEDSASARLEPPKEIPTQLKFNF